MRIQTKKKTKIKNNSIHSDNIAVYQRKLLFLSRLFCSFVFHKRCHGHGSRGTTTIISHKTNFISLPCFGFSFAIRLGRAGSRFNFNRKKVTRVIPVKRKTTNMDVPYIHNRQIKFWGKKARKHTPAHAQRSKNYGDANMSS